MRKLRVIWQGTFVVFCYIVFTQGLADEGTDGIRTSLEADDLAVVSAGEKVYQENCASCHGDQLEGQPNWRLRDANGYLPAPPHDDIGHTWHHADDLLFEITKYGPAKVIGDATYKTLMPAYQYLLTDQEIVAVLSYIKNSWPQEQRLWQEQVNGNQLGILQNDKAKETSVLERIFK